MVIYMTFLGVIVIVLIDSVNASYLFQNTTQLNVNTIIQADTSEYNGEQRKAEWRNIKFKVALLNYTRHIYYSMQLHE